MQTILLTEDQVKKLLNNVINEEKKAKKPVKKDEKPVKKVKK